MEKWYVAAKKADFEGWAARFGISPVLARILRNRDLIQEEEIEKFLRGNLSHCYPPEGMKDMDLAVELLLQAIGNKKAIRVIGDYDVDGICSAYILTKGLTALGARVDTAIPHRIHDGYGLNDHLIQLAAEEGIELILTCDNGISAGPQIELAASLGIGVIVTDHHEVPYTEEEGVRKELLPPALAVVNPKQESCRYPFKNICGAVVAYKLIQALVKRTGGAEEVLEELLELAALATVCDVMELKDENRIIVKEGLKRLRNPRNLGLRALMEVCALEPASMNAYHLGFVLGPCLNATGRLDTALRALELLQSTTKAQAVTVASQLKELNDSRKNMTLQGVQQAEEYIASHGLEKQDVMMIYLPQVHESLAGIIAGRIREKYHHPVFVLTKGEEGVKGSGRSIEAYHMYEAMTEVKEFFTRYGGHRLAAGLSMAEEDLEALSYALNEKSRLVPEDFIPRVHIDVPMPLCVGNETLAEELELLEPFGVGNPKPLFAQRDLLFLSCTRMGTNKNFAKFRVQTPQRTVHQVVYFGDMEKFDAFFAGKYGEEGLKALYRGQGNFTVSVVYQLSRNIYRGRTEVQYVMQNYC